MRIRSIVLFMVATFCVAIAFNRAIAEDNDKKRIAFVTNQVASFWNIAKVGCLDAADDFDVDVDVRFPKEATVTDQKQIIEDLLTSGIDAIAVSPIDATNQKNAVNKWAAKVPLITHDSDAPNTDRLMYVGMDNYRGGRLVGRLIKHAYPNGCKLIITIGRLEQDNAKKRRQGVIDELLGRDNEEMRFDDVDAELSGNGYTIYATLTDQGKPEVAKQKAEDALNAYSDVDVFAGLFVYNPPACMQAIKQAHRENKVKVVGFDEDDLTLQGIKDGTVIGTVVQDPYQYGYQSVRILNEILKGNKSIIPKSKFIDIPARAITKRVMQLGDAKTLNVDDFWADLRDKTGE